MDNFILFCENVFSKYFKIHWQKKNLLQIFEICERNCDIVKKC